MNDQAIIKRKIELKGQAIFLFNRSKPEGYRNKIKKIEWEIERLKRSLADATQSAAA